VLSGHDMVVTGVSEAPVPRLLGEGRSILPSLSEAVWNSSRESPVMAHSRDGGPPWAEPMAMASKPSPVGERLKPPKRSAMNLRLPKRMVSLREKPPHDRHSPSAVTASANDGTIRTSRGKPHCKSPFLVCQLLVFFAPARYRVVKILRFYSEMVLRTMKNYKAHYSLSWFRPLL
jgi:hypothetical protein